MLKVKIAVSFGEERRVNDRKGQERSFWEAGNLLFHNLGCYWRVFHL